MNRDGKACYGFDGGFKHWTWTWTPRVPSNWIAWQMYRASYAKPFQQGLCYASHFHISWGNKKKMLFLPEQHLFKYVCLVNVCRRTAYSATFSVAIDNLLRVTDVMTSTMKFWTRFCSLMLIIKNYCDKKLSHQIDMRLSVIFAGIDFLHNVNRFCQWIHVSTQSLLPILFLFLFYVNRAQSERLTECLLRIIQST